MSLRRRRPLGRRASTASWNLGSLRRSLVVLVLWMGIHVGTTTGFIIPVSTGTATATAPASVLASQKKNRKNPTAFAAAAVAVEEDGKEEEEEDRRSDTTTTTDVIVIGSGIGGLSAAACIASTGNYEVTVCESHAIPGGAAHAWQVQGYHFESGPSLYAGLSADASPNPLKHVFQIIGEEPEWTTYDRWGTYLPEGNLIADGVGTEEFYDKLAVCGGPEAAAQWTRLLARIRPLGDAIFALPSAAVRSDAFVGVTLGVRYGTALLQVLRAGGSTLQQPFATILDEERITDPFILHWLDMLCFLLQGTTTQDAPTTLMAYMLSDFYRPQVVLDYPLGGTQAIVNALVRGVTKYPNCHVDVKTHIDTILVDSETKRVNGVRTSDGRIIRARKAVICNADLWTTRALVDPNTAPELARDLDDRIHNQIDGRCDSFLHLHVGINATGLPTAPSATFPAQWASIDDWEIGVDAPRNLVLVSIASLLDPNLAPAGCHTIHAYVPATEPYKDWLGLDRKSTEYKRKKEEAAEILWQAIEKQIPDVRARVDISMIGTPLTHERFLRRDQGSYGPFVSAAGSSSSMLPGQKTSLPGFYCCGDSTFPGIGMPAAAASGIIAANNVISPLEHWRMLDKIKL